MACGTFEVVPSQQKQGPMSRLVKLPPATGVALAFHLLYAVTQTASATLSCFRELTMPPQSDEAKNSEALGQDKSSPGLERWLYSEERLLFFQRT